MADDATESAKKRLADEKQSTERSRQEYAERMKGKPTPTQEENDLAALGAHVTEKEDDGSGPDPYEARNMEVRQGQSGGSYQTRTVTPAGQATPGGAPQKPPKTSTTL